MSADGTDGAVARGREVEVGSRDTRSADGYACTANAYPSSGLNDVTHLQTVQTDLPARPVVIGANDVANTALGPANGTVLGALGTPGQRRLDSADLQTWIDYTAVRYDSPFDTRCRPAWPRGLERQQPGALDPRSLRR